MVTVLSWCQSPPQSTSQGPGAVSGHREPSSQATSWGGLSALRPPPRHLALEDAVEAHECLREEPGEVRGGALGGGPPGGDVLE